MSFLSPSALWLLPLAAGPLVLHLLSLRRARRVVFSDLTLLRQAHARSLPATRLRQLLILLARCLALAGLVLAAARPVVRGGAASSSGENGMDLAVLVDTSWSMEARERGRPRFEKARAAAKALAALAGPADRVAVAGASQGLDGPLAFARTAAEAGEALDRLAPGPRGTDLASAAAAACRFLSEARAPSPRRRVVAVMSDNASHGLAGFGGGGPAALPACGADAVFVGLAWDAAPPNAAVIDAEPAPDAPEGPGVSARAALFGGGRRRTALDLVARGARTSRRSVDLAEGAPASFPLTLPSGREPEAWGRVELPPDALEADDGWWFALRSEPRPRVLLLAGGPRSLEAGGGGYALRSLLGDGSRLPYRFDSVDQGRSGQVRLEDYSVVMLDDPRALPAAAAEALERYVRAGGALWVVAGAQAAPPALDAIARLLPATLGPAQAGPAGAGLKADEAPSDGPRRFSWDEFELARVVVGKRYSAAPRPGAAVWFRDAAGAPLLVAGEYGRGRVLLWAASLEVGWTNLALKPVFAGVVDAGLRWLARYEGRPQWRGAAVGKPLVRAWGPSERAPARVTLRGPGGRLTALLVRDRRVSYEDTREPGLYFLEWPAEGEGEKAHVEAWAVNLDRSGGESDLTMPAAPPWRALRPESLREDFDAAVRGREARTGLLAAAGLLLALELLLARPRGDAASRGPAARAAREGAAV